ncbi:putative chitinase 10 [Araneus ventricosus]|uniref:Putative chitinase 10 n=1 Tax=Araneus ventricosus TaxID=182803 RepID=A0A4Y2B6U7_ARAVE|nr:putative chitinase 10 [Araneus ventricosus]
MARNPHTAEYSPPSHFTPNSSPGMGRNRYPASRNSELSDYSGNDSRQNRRHPTDMRSNRNYPASDNSNNNNPVYNDANNRSPPYYNSNNRNRADYSSNNNNPAYYNSNRRPAAYNSGDNHPTYFNPDNNRSPYSNSNNNYPARFSPNNNRNVPSERSGRPRNRHRDQRNFPNDGYSGNDPLEGQSVRDPHTASYNHPENFSPNNYNPSNNKAPNNRNPYNNNAPNNYNPANNNSRNEEQNFPFYIYYQVDPLKGGRIVCLFTAAKFLKSGFKPTMIPARLCTVVNYEFATLNSTTYEISPGHPDLDYGQEFYNKTVGLKYLNPYLKVMLSLGGWTDSTKKYSDLVASPKKVNNFITKAVQFLKDNKFDGLDVAWEYPNCWQGALGVSPQDKPNYAKFLKKIRKAFDRENLLLSISVSSIQREIKEGYNGTEIAKAVHFINVMTYDMHGPWEKKTGHHSQFGKTLNDSDPTLNSKAAMEFWASIGVPKLKLNMGIATYATTFTLKDATEHGLGAPAKGPGKAGALSHNAGTLYYREICQYLDAGNWTEEEDEDAGFYAYSGDQWAGYDHPRMVVKKTRWIADNGYGGLLIKDVSGDDYEQKCFTKRFPLIWIAGMEFTLRLKGKP